MVEAVPPGYERLRALGSGGFGEVVLARHLALGRVVAVKRIHAAALADRDSVERFRREARLLASIDHPAVVKAYDLAVGPDGAFLVMEYVAGQPLSDLLEAGPLPAARGLPVLRDVADALHVAASRGIVHRDVKPHNVFVTAAGRAKLGDFGLARAVTDPTVFRTSVGTALGTPAYYAPELARGGAEPDERSDAYSFAVVAYETLTGRRPYEFDDAIALLTAHWRLEPPDPRSLLPGLPDAAAQALLAGLRKDPAARLMPRQLVERLEAIAPGAWPDVARRKVSSSPGLRSAVTMRVEVAGPEPSGVARAPRRPRARWVLLAAAAPVAIGLSVAASGLVTGGDEETDLVVRDLRVESDPDPARATCPRAVVDLVAVVGTNGASGEVDLEWTGPDGRRLAEQTIEVESGQRHLEARLRLTLSGRQPVRGDVVVVVRDEDLRASRPVSYDCPVR